MNVESNPNLQLYNPCDQISTFEESDEIVFNIFSYLKVDDLLTCSQLSVNCERIASDKRLWKLFIKVLEIPQEVNCRVETGLKINALRKCITSGIALMNEMEDPVTQKEYENFIVSYSHTWSLIQKGNFDSDLHKENPVYKFMVFRKKLEIEFKACLDLWRVGFCDLVKVETYANTLLKKGLMLDGWEMLCRVYIENKDYKKADTCIKRYIEPHAQRFLHKCRESYNWEMISNHIENNEFDDAIEIYISMYEAMVKTMDNDKVKFIEKLESSVIKAKRFDLYACMIDVIGSEFSEFHFGEFESPFFSFKANKALDYLGFLVEAEKIDELKIGVTKYGDLIKRTYILFLGKDGLSPLDKSENLYKYQSLLDAYAELGLISQIWDFINLSKGSLDYIYCLHAAHNALKIRNFEASEKCEQLILEESEQLNRFELFENKIDLLNVSCGFGKLSRLIMISQLLMEIAKTKNKQMIYGTVLKYKDEAFHGSFDPTGLAMAYIQLGDIDDVWKIIEYRKEIKSNAVDRFKKIGFLAFLERIFTEFMDNGYHAEAEKVERMISELSK